jgi:hypothetical protein
MDLEAFRSAANRVRAEQILQEKAASARASVSAVAFVGLARAGMAEDQELLKVAAQFCPGDPLGFYAKLGGKFASTSFAHVPETTVEEPEVKSAQLERRSTVKVAEPPPPSGMSVKEWDRVLSKGPPAKDKTKVAQLQLSPGLQRVAGHAPPSGISAATWNAILNKGQSGA